MKKVLGVYLSLIVLLLGMVLFAFYQYRDFAYSKSLEALYDAGEYESALEGYESRESPSALHNRGNTYVKLWEQGGDTSLLYSALDSYNAALALRFDPHTSYNYELVKDYLDTQQTQDEQDSEQSEEKSGESSSNSEEDSQQEDSSGAGESGENQSGDIEEQDTSGDDSSSLHQNENSSSSNNSSNISSEMLQELEEYADSLQQNQLFYQGQYNQQDLSDSNINSLFDAFFQADSPQGGKTW